VNPDKNEDLVPYVIFYKIKGHERRQASILIHRDTASLIDKIKYVNDTIKKKCRLARSENRKRYTGRELEEANETAKRNIGIKERGEHIWTEDPEMDRKRVIYGVRDILLAYRRDEYPMDIPTLAIINGVASSLSRIKIANIVYVRHKGGSN
jgi:hypothetical protein